MNYEERPLDSFKALRELSTYKNWMIHNERLIPHSPHTGRPCEDADLLLHCSDYGTARAAIQGKPGWGVGFLLKGTPFRVLVLGHDSSSRYDADDDIANALRTHRDNIREQFITRFRHTYYQCSAYVPHLTPLTLGIWYRGNIQYEMTWPTLGITILSISYVPFTNEALNNNSIDDCCTAETDLLEALAGDKGEFTNNYIDCTRFTFGHSESDYAIDNLILAGAITRILSPPKWGKTTVVNAMCKSMDKGEPFLDLSTTKRPVLILDRENPHRGIEERLKRLGIQLTDNFRYLDYHTCKGRVPDPWSNYVTNYVERSNPKPAVVIDSYIAFFEGNDENNSQDTRRFYAQLDPIKHAGAAIIILDHCNKKFESRGSSDKEAAIDVDFALSNDGLGAELTSLTLRVRNRRMFDVIDELTFKYENSIFVRTYPQGDDATKKRR